MSYMTPYYFTASAGQSISVWMRSTDFESKVGLASSGSTTLLVEASNNAWAYNDLYSASAFRYTCPSSGIYKVECTSTTDGQTGNFKLYITEAETGSIVTDNQSYMMIYNPVSNRIFSTEFGVRTSGPWFEVYSSSITIFDGSSLSNVKTLYGTSSYIVSKSKSDPKSVTGSNFLIDAVYNSTNNNIYVWTIGGEMFTSSFMEIWDGSGSALLNTYPMDIDFGGVQFPSGYLVYNRNDDQILLLPNGGGFGPTNFSYSLYDCNSNAIVHTELMPYGIGFPTFVSSTNTYYIPPANYGDAAIKVSSVDYTSSLSSIVNSCVVLSYIPELDVMVGGGGSWPNGFYPPAQIYNARTEQVITDIPGVLDFETPCVYDPCRKCIVIADDVSGAPNADLGTVGGLSFINSGSWTPSNFIAFSGSWGLAFCNSTSTIWASNYNDNQIIIIVPSNPTGSLPQPGYPVDDSPPDAPIVVNGIGTNAPSATFIWRSGSNIQNEHYAVERSLNVGGPYTYLARVTGSTLPLSYVDTSVSNGTFYHYKVASVNPFGTSSFTAPISILVP